MIRIRPQTHLFKHGLTVHAKVHFSRGTSQTVYRTNSCFSYASLIYFSISCSFKQLILIQSMLTAQNEDHILSYACTVICHICPISCQKKNGVGGGGLLVDWLQALVSRNTNPYLWQYFSTIMGSKLKNLVLQSGQMHYKVSKCVPFALTCEGLRR